MSNGRRLPREAETRNRGACAAAGRGDVAVRHDRWISRWLAVRPATEALAILEKARPLYKQFPDVHTQLRLHWLEAKISHNLGKLAEAESTLQQLWEEFRTRNLNHELLLVSIDLAETFARKGEPARAAELVQECYPLLVAWGLQKDALAAWLVFQDALARGQVGGIFRRVREYYYRHWTRPGAFEPA